MTKLFNDQGGLDKIKAHLEIAKQKMPTDVRDAHVHCSQHRHEILASQSCGCFYCLEMFQATEIEDWLDDGQTALCPSCGIDSAIGSASGFSLTKEFLDKMHGYWF